MGQLQRVRCLAYPDSLEILYSHPDVVFTMTCRYLKGEGPDEYSKTISIADEKAASFASGQLKL
jgi:hypothetical protein